MRVGCIRARAVRAVLRDGQGEHRLEISAIAIGLNRPESGGTVPISVTASRRPTLQQFCPAFVVKSICASLEQLGKRG